MMSSGDLCDPVTRIPFTDEQLVLIDSKAKSIDLVSGLDALRKEGSSKKAMEDMKFRRNALCGIERLAGDCIASILKHCEDKDADFVSIQSEILTNELPAFIDYFTQLRDEDGVYASQCMSHWISYLKGPPNRPNQDEIDMISLGYSLGPVAIQAQYKQVDNIAGYTGADVDVFAVKVGTRF